MNLHGQEADHARIRCHPRLQPPVLDRLLNDLAGDIVRDLTQLVVDGLRNPHVTELFREKRQAVDAGEVQIGDVLRTAGIAAIFVHLVLCVVSRDAPLAQDG
jgi:hypothetical protein